MVRRGSFLSVPRVVACARRFSPGFVLAGTLAVATALVPAGCASGQATRVLDPDADDNLGGTGTDSGDVRSLAERISRSLIGIRWPKEGAVPRIAVLPLDNQSRFRIDPVLIQNKLVKELVNNAAGRLEFLARDSEQAVLEERAKKRGGLYDAGATTEAMAGADYLLRGEMRSLTKAAGSGTSDYIVYSFKLVNAETGAIVWMDDFETKKAGETGVIYQ
jgi:PBP1b-binding outer membrane lipoprotein LpoB